MRLNDRNWVSIHGFVVRLRCWLIKHPMVVLFALISATAVAVYHPFLFGREIFVYADIGGDTQNVYYPFFAALYRKLENADFSMMDFTHGLGTSILSRPADSASVFTYMQFILGAGGMKYALVYVHILKILLAGMICYGFLSSFKLSNLSRILAAYIYAFNGFTVLWGQHYFFATASVYMILMLFAIERSFAGDKGYLLVAFSTFLVMLNTYYLAYMVLLVAAVYALFRLASMYTIGQIGAAARRVVGLLLAVIVGAMMSACIFLPAVYHLLGTNDRVTGGLSLLDKLVYFATEFTFDNDTLWGIASRFFSNNLMGTVDYDGPLNYYEMPQWFFTSFIVFFAVLFLTEIILDRRETVKIKILKLLAFALVVYLAFNPLLSLVLNGFVTYFFRYTFVVMPFFALCFADMLDKLFRRKFAAGVVQILLAAVVTAAVFALVVIKIESGSLLGKKIALVHLLLLFALGLLSVVLQMICDHKHIKRLVIVGIVAVFVLNVTVECDVTTNSRYPISRVNENIYLTNGNDDVKKALEYIEDTDPSFHRTEKTFQDISYLNDSMLEGYYGVSVYNSTVNRDVVDFVAQMAPALKAQIPDGYYDFRAIVTDVERVSLLGVKYILSKEYLADIPEYAYIASFGAVHLYRNTKTEGIAQFFPAVIDRKAYEELGEQERYECMNTTLVLEELQSDWTGAEQVAQQSFCKFSKPSNSSYISGTVNAAQNGWLFLSIPLEDGWTAYVDGIQTDIQKANYAFCGIRIDAGEHKVELRYNTPLLKESMVISCVGVVVFGVWMLSSLLKSRKKCNK